MNKSGDIAEMAMMFKSTLAGFTVFTPHGQDTAIDIIITKGKGKPITIQVKKGVKQPKAKPHHIDSWKVVVGSLKSSSRKSKSPRLKRYTNEFDILAIYIQELDVLSFYKLKDIKHISTKRWSEKSGVSENWDIFDDWNTPLLT